MLEAEKSTAMAAIKGEVTEWLKVLVSKTSVPGFRYRGFESHPLRQIVQGRSRHCHSSAKTPSNQPPETIASPGGGSELWLVASFLPPAEKLGSLPMYLPIGS